MYGLSFPSHAKSEPPLGPLCQQRCCKVDFRTAVTLPAFLCIIFVAAVFKNALENRGVNALLYGLRPCVIGIILATGIYISFQNLFVDAAMSAFGWREIVLTFILGLIMFGSEPILKKKASPIHLIIISAVLGIVLYA